MSRRTLVLHLAPPAPPCFETRQAWVEFVCAAAEETKGGRLGPIDARTSPAKFNTAFDFCRGCLAKHALAMLDEGRCQPHYLRGAVVVEDRSVADAA